MLEVNDKGDSIKVNNELACDMCGECIELSNKLGKNAIDVKPSETDMIFTIETWGQLSNKDIFFEISEELKKQLKDLDKELSKIKI